MIFSDKTISWPGGNDIDLAWRRWFKHAVLKSFKQIRGAERWIDQFPDRIFLDRKCTEQLPLKIPPKERRQVHGIAVALGAGQASKDFFGEGSGSLMITPKLIGKDHIDPKAAHYSPFAIGDLDPHGSFVHVLDDSTLKIIMEELDTVTDFTSYLRKKEGFIRSGHLIAAHGEEDLLARYLIRVNRSGEHDFVKNDGTSWKADDSIFFDAGIYEGFVRNSQYQAKKAADNDSYVWDALIEAFTDNMLAGTTLVSNDAEFDLAEHEKAIRHMALVPRYERRMFARGILDALRKSQDQDRFVRGFLPGPTASRRDTGFFFMTLKVPNITLDRGYDQYREVRRWMLYGYALSLLRKNPQLERIIGIATEPPAKPGAPKGASEDFMLVEMPKWNQSVLDELAKYEADFDIMKEGRFGEYQVFDKEYPDVDRKAHKADSEQWETPNNSGLNRAQRRAPAAKVRKGKK